MKKIDNGCKCPAPSCKINCSGVCCNDCKHRATCSEACLNDKDTCENYGRNKKLYELHKYSFPDKNGVEWVELGRAERILKEKQV